MDAAETYTELHEGLAPDRWFPRQRVPETPRHPRRIGAAAWIQYAKSTTDGTHPYRHDFAPHARPTVIRGDSGELQVLRGRYVTTVRGIEDRAQRAVATEQFAGQPKLLVDLGKLEKLGYTSKAGSQGTSRTIDFGRTGPVVAHDERGDLWFLGGRYNLPRGEAMRTVMRANPTNTMTVGKAAMSIGAGMVQVGGPAVLTVLGFRWAGAKLNTKPDNTARLGAYPYAIASGAAGLVLATGVFLAGKRSPLATKLSAGIATGAAVETGILVYTKFMADRALARTNPGMVAAGPTVPTAPAPGAPVQGLALTVASGGQVRGLPRGGIPGTYTMNAVRVAARG